MTFLGLQKENIPEVVLQSFKITSLRKLCHFVPGTTKAEPLIPSESTLPCLTGHLALATVSLVLSCCQSFPIC